MTGEQDMPDGLGVDDSAIHTVGCIVKGIVYRKNVLTAVAKGDFVEFGM